MYTEGKYTYLLGPKECNKRPEVWTRDQTLDHVGVTAPCLWSSRWTMSIVDKYSEMRIVLSQGWGLSWQNTIYHWFFKGLDISRNNTLDGILAWIRVQQHEKLYFGYMADPDLPFEWAITAGKYNVEYDARSTEGPSTDKLGLLSFRRVVAVTNLETDTSGMMKGRSGANLLEWVSLTSDARTTLVLNQVFVLESGICRAKDPSRRRKYDPEKPFVQAQANSVPRAYFNMLPGFFMKSLAAEGDSQLPWLADAFDPDVKSKYNRVPTPDKTVSNIMKNMYFLAWSKDDKHTIIADAFSIDESGIMLSVHAVDTHYRASDRPVKKIVSMITRNEMSYAMNFFLTSVDQVAPFREAKRLVGKFWDCTGKKMDNVQRVFSFVRFLPYNGVFNGGCPKPSGEPEVAFATQLKCVFEKDCVASMRVTVLANSYFNITGGFQITVSITTLKSCTSDFRVLELLPPTYANDILKRHKDFPQLTTDSTEAFFHTGYLDAWVLINCAAQRAELFECLTWQYDRGPCDNHGTGVCAKWETCDLEDRILHDCFLFDVDRQTECAKGGAFKMGLLPGDGGGGIMDGPMGTGGAMGAGGGGGAMGGMLGGGSGRWVSDVNAQATGSSWNLFSGTPNEVLEKEEEKQKKIYKQRGWGSNTYEDEERWAKDRAGGYYSNPYSF